MWHHDPPKTIGPVHSFGGNFAVLVRAYAYLRDYGLEACSPCGGDRAQRELPADSAAGRLTRSLHGDRHYMHEFVGSGEVRAKRSAAFAMDVAKRLLDYGMHPPTVYFPLTMAEA